MITNRLAKADPSLSDFFPSAKPVAGFAGAAFAHDHPDEEIGLIVALHRDSPPDGFGKLKWKRITAGIFTVPFPKNQLSALIDSPDVETVYGPRPMRLTTSTPDAMGVTGLRQAHLLNRTGKEVVVGVVDHGFDLRHPDFRDDQGNTRVAYYWDQSAEGRKASYGYGVEYTQEEINAILKRDRNAQSPDPLCTTEAGAHGTYVAGIAAGNGRAASKEGPDLSGVAPDAILILVNLHRVGLHTEHIHVVQALEWIFNKADTGFEEEGDYGFLQLAKFSSKTKRKMPCVVNLSFTYNEGSHDGYAPVERAVDGLLFGSRGRAVVVAAGNSAAHDLHAEWSYTSGATTELLWEIPAGDNDLPMTQETALWYSSRDEITAQLVSPDGTESAIIYPGLEDRKMIDKTTTEIQSVRFVNPGGDSRIFIKLGHPVAVGTWKVRLKALSASRAGTLHGWLDSTPDEPLRSRFASHSSTRITLGSPSAARFAVTVGNIDPATMTVVDSSGRGPTRDRREKPEVAAPGASIRAAGSRGGTKDAAGDEIEMYVMAWGTSASAPHISGLIACLFEQNDELTATQVQKVLVAAAAGESYDEGAGYGMVDAAKALELVSNYVKRDRD